MTNTLTNLIGISVLALGLVQIQRLDRKQAGDEEPDEKESSELDLALLRWSYEPMMAAV